MAHTYEELKSKTVEELREIAKGLDHEAVKGFSQMNKDHLLPALCKALGIDAHIHHHATGIDKPGIKAKMKALKKQRADALAAHDPDLLKSVRRQLHHFNRQIRAHLQ
jgi:Rho termination factor-like protein